MDLRVKTIQDENLEKIKKIANDKNIKIDIIGKTQSEIFEIENDFKSSNSIVKKEKAKKKKEPGWPQKNIHPILG